MSVMTTSGVTRSRHSRSSRPSPAFRKDADTGDGDLRWNGSARTSGWSSAGRSKCQEVAVARSMAARSRAGRLQALRKRRIVAERRPLQRPCRCRHAAAASILAKLFRQVRAADWRRSALVRQSRVAMALHSLPQAPHGVRMDLLARGQVPTRAPQVSTPSWLAAPAGRRSSGGARRPRRTSPHARARGHGRRASLPSRCVLSRASMSREASSKLSIRPSKKPPSDPRAGARQSCPARAAGRHATTAQ